MIKNDFQAQSKDHCPAPFQTLSALNTEVHRKHKPWIPMMAR